MRIYISGAITDNPNYKEDFARGEAKLREKYPDAQIFNPLRIYEVFPDVTWRQYTAICSTMLSMCDTIYLLREWYYSEDVLLECRRARGRGMNLYYED